MFKYLFDSTMKSRNIMINCKRKASFRRKDMPYNCFVKFNEYQRLLMNNLGIGTRDATKVLWYQRNIFNIPKDHIVKQCQLCMKWNIDITTLFKNAELLHWHHHTFENRVLLLQEMGIIYMHAAMVSSFGSIMSLRMTMFKALAKIPKQTNIAENLLSYMDQPPAGVPPMEIPSDDLSVGDYHKHCLRWYIQWKLEIPKDDTEQLSQVIYSLKERSFTMMRKMFDILHNDVGLTVKQIKMYNCLGGGSPDNLRKIIDNIRMFYGRDIKKLIRSDPLLHRMDYDNVVQVMNLLDKQGFNEKSIRRYPKICIVPKYKVEARFEKLENIPELRVLKNNSNALRLVHKFRMAQVRLSYLRYLDIKQATVRALTGDTWNFEKYVKTGIDRTRGKEIAASLEKRLRLEPREVRRRLEKHPYWRQIGLISMHDTLNFLLERFAPEDLHDSLQLILYSREKIAEVLDGLPELNQTFWERKKNNQLNSPRYILAMCMYEIEREYHFTGDGVWRSEATMPRQIATTKISDNELSDFSDSENSETEDIDLKSS